VSERLGKDRIAALNEDGKYGEGEKGFKRPRTARDKMRRGTPYKVSGMGLGEWGNWAGEKGEGVLEEFGEN